MLDCVIVSVIGLTNDFKVVRKVRTCFGFWCFEEAFTRHWECEVNMERWWCFTAGK